MQFFVTDGSVETHRGAKSEENADRLGSPLNGTAFFDGVFKNGICLRLYLEMKRQAETSNW